MSNLVKITLNIPVDLKKLIEKAALEEDRSETKIVERALRAALEKNKR